MTRVLIVGAGSIAPRHLTHLAAIPDVELAGICDPLPDRAEALARRWPRPVALFNELDRAMAEVTADYLLLLTPRRVRESVVTACIERGLPLLMEKPPCHDLATGHRCARRLSESGLLHGVAFMHRWNGAVDEARRLLAGRTLAQVVIRYGSPQASKPLPTGPLGPYGVAESGGLIGDQGIHYLDLARWLCGEVVSIKAMTSTQLLQPPADSPDTAGWLLGMDSGCMVVHAHTWCGPRWWCEVDLIWAQGRLHLDLFAATLTGHCDGQAVAYTAPCNEFERQHRGFQEALRLGDQSLVRSSYADAVTSFATAEAVAAAV